MTVRGRLNGPIRARRFRIDPRIAARQDGLLRSFTGSFMLIAVMAPIADAELGSLTRPSWTCARRTKRRLTWGSLPRTTDNAGSGAERGGCGTLQPGRAPSIPQSISAGWMSPTTITVLKCRLPGWGTACQARPKEHVMAQLGSRRRSPWHRSVLKNGCRPVQAARRRISQTVTAMSSADSASSQPASIH